MADRETFNIIEIVEKREAERKAREGKMADLHRKVNVAGHAR